MSAMDKNSMPPKTKPPPSESSEEESGSSDEETEDEEQAEGGSGFESGSDESTDTTKKKLISILPPKQSAVKAPPLAATPGSPAKRTREANGKKEKEDEPASKKKKAEVATPAPKAAPKPTAQQLDKKSASKAEKIKATPAKEKPLKDSAVEKDSAVKKSTTKRKTQSPAVAKPTSSRSEDDTVQKPKMDVRHWSHDEELALSREIQKDRVNDVYGSNLPAARADPYWETLLDRLPFVNQYEEELRIERLCEKVRRMRIRYESLNMRLKAGETSVYKSAHEGVLWRIWHTIWGPNKATPSMLNGDDEGEDEEEEDGSDDDGSDEDEEEEIAPTQGKGRQTTVGKATAPKKALGKKVVADDSSSDDESNKDDSPVNATPPATSVPRKQAPVSKSVPAKGLAPTAMDVASGKNTSKRVAVHNGAQGGHAVIPAMIEKSVRANDLPKVSDEMRAENLALLRDMRGTCVKMVEEAKAQSLLITEKILEDTRVKSTQIVEEASTKSAQIMEELRLFVERVGTITGGRANGSHVGRWSDFSDDPFQGTGLHLGSPLPLGDSLDGKWREQNEAEQGLLLQRLQLVQEQARIQQEGIRLKLNHQKQQSLSGIDKQA